MHLRLLPEKGKYKFRGVKMEILVTKFSKGKYRNEGDSSQSQSLPRTSNSWAR